MTISFTYTAQLAGAAECASEAIELPDGTNAAAAVNQVAERHGPRFSELLFGDDGQLRPSVLVVHNGTQATRPDAAVLGNGDTVMLITPMAGG
jgi:molybdopterin converting factor small subunit